MVLAQSKMMPPPQGTWFLIFLVRLYSKFEGKTMFSGAVLAVRSCLSIQISQGLQGSPAKKNI